MHLLMRLMHFCGNIFKEISLKVDSQRTRKERNGDLLRREKNGLTQHTALLPLGIISF